MVASVSAAALELAGVSYRYGQLTALAGVDLRVAAGTRHAVIGPNGAGKSTLLAIVAGTLRPDHGRVLLGGRDVTGRGPARRARLGIGRTFQQPAVIPTLSPLDNMTIAAWRLAGDGVGRAGGWTRRRRLAGYGAGLLDLVGLDPADRSPAGELPHGHRRLLELAMALAGRPRLLLLDEPSAGLAGTETARVDRVLRTGLAEGTAVLLVEHDLDLVAALAGTVTVLHAGRVLANGPLAQVANRPEVTAVYPIGAPR